MPLWVSLALAVRICVPETEAGREARLTVGGVSSTVTVTGAEVAVFPAPSVAMAVSVCWMGDTLVVFQENVQGAAVTVARGLPSTRNWTLAMPLWVSLALAMRVCVPETDGGREARLTVGGVSSTVVDITADVLTFPATSRATAVMLCGPGDTLVVSHQIV